MVLAFAYCNVAVLPVRSEPTHTAEQTTQLLFGERAEIIEIDSNDWARIRCGWDDYIGWCKKGQLKELSRKEYRKASKYLVGNHISKIAMESGDMVLPYGAELTGLTGGKITPLQEVGSFKGKKLNKNEDLLTRDNLKAAALEYLNAPYQWGGRSVAGIDCSGLTQMAYKMCGYALPRDASQQAKAGQMVDFLQYAKCGDLAFFDNKEGNITHVGLLLDSETIIHATDTSGRVVIDKIDLGGIISKTLRKRTHNLRMVKSIIQ